MSMELYVLLQSRDLPTIVEWQQKLEELGFPVRLDPAFDPVTDRGFRPSELHGLETGFEFSVSPLSEIASAYPELTTLIGVYDSAAAFTWGVELEGAAVAFAAAGALLVVGSGALYDPQEAILLKHASAVEYARGQYDQIIAAMEP